MGKSSTLNVGAGAFVLLGFAALAFLTTQTTNHGIHLGTRRQLLRGHRQVRQYRRPQGGSAGVHGGRGRRSGDAHRSRHQAIQGGGVDAAQLEIQPDSERQRCEHLHPRIARRKIRRAHGRRRRYLPQEQRSDRIYPIGARARKSDRPAGGKFQQQGVGLLGVIRIFRAGPAGNAPPPKPEKTK